jgi:hypothetical protein
VGQSLQKDCATRDRRVKGGAKNLSIERKPIAIARIIAEAPMLTITGAVVFDVPDTATFLERFAEAERHDQLRRIMELGTQITGVMTTSSTLQMVEAQISGMTKDLTAQLAIVMVKDRETSIKLVRELLDDHRGKVSTSLTRYLDPESQASIPVAMAKVFDKAAEALLERVEILLSEGDESALGHLADRFTKELDAATATIIDQMAARHALTTKSALAGRPYEDVVEQRMTALARPLGDQVTRCGDTLGQMRRKNGDIVITISPEAVNGRTDVRMVGEAKHRSETAQVFSANDIKDSLGLARRNRGAGAGLFITEAAALLPLGTGFHEYGGSNIAVTYDPNSDDTALAVAYRLLRVALIQDARGAAGEQIDRDAHKRIVADIRTALTKLDTVRTQHQAAINGINRASTAVTELNDSVLRGLRQLDDLMEA